MKSFEHFDNKNKVRVQSIRNSIIEQKDDLSSVDKILGDVTKYVRKNKEILDRYKTVWKNMNNPN